MKKSIFTTFLIVLTVVFTLSVATCFSQSSGSGKSINSAEALKEYLDKQPANSPDKPIKITMSANAPMLPKIKEAINSAGKYVSLNISGNALITIPDDAFEYCETLVSITMPNSITSIGDEAFFRCISLPSITIPNSVTSIEEGAFSGCKSLTSVSIPNSVTSIGSRGAGAIAGVGGAFSNCISLTSVTIPASVTSIRSLTFRNCTRLTSVTFQGVNTNIDDNSFPGNIREIYLAKDGGPGTYKRFVGGETWTKQ